MRAVVQRVSKARVTVEERITGAVAKGLVVLLAVHPDDSEADLEFMKRKLLNLRIFSDDSENSTSPCWKLVGEFFWFPSSLFSGTAAKGTGPVSVERLLPISQSCFMRE